MQTGILSARFADTKTPEKAPAGKVNPSSFHHKFTNRIFGSKKKYIFLTITLVIAGVVVFLLLNASNNKKSLNSTQLNAKLTNSGSSSQQDKTSDSSQGSTSGQTEGSSSTSVKVNGQSVDVPQSGPYDKTVNVPGGTVHVSGNNSSSGSSSTNNSTVNVDVH